VYGKGKMLKGAFCRGKKDLLILFGERRKKKDPFCEKKSDSSREERGYSEGEGASSRKKRALRTGRYWIYLKD